MSGLHTELALSCSKGLAANNARRAMQWARGAITPQWAWRLAQHFGRRGTSAALQERVAQDTRQAYIAWTDRAVPASRAISDLHTRGGQRHTGYDTGLLACHHLPVGFVISHGSSSPTTISALPA